MSWQKNAASAGAGILPYVVGALGLWAINVERIRFATPRASSILFLLLVAVGLAITFVGPYIASNLNPMNLARAAVFGLLVHALGLLLPAFVASFTDETAAGAGVVFLRFYFIAGGLTTPLAVGGGVAGALVRERHRAHADPKLPRTHGGE